MCFLKTSQIRLIFHSRATPIYQGLVASELLITQFTYSNESFPAKISMQRGTDRPSSKIGEL